MLEGIFCVLLLEAIKLSLFNDIICVAIACNIAYLLISRQSRKHAAVLFLITFAKNQCDKTIFERNKKNGRHVYTKELERVNGIYDKLRSEQQEEHKSLFDFIRNYYSRKLEEIELEHKAIEDYFSTDKCVRTSGVSCATFVCFIYGLTLLLLSGIERHNESIQFHFFLSIFNIVVLAISLYCIILSNFSKKGREKWFKPFYFILVSLSLGIIYYRIGSPLIFIGDNGQNITYLMSILLCWIGIILFLLNGIFLILTKSFLYRRKLKKDKITESILDTGELNKVLALETEYKISDIKLEPEDVSNLDLLKIGLKP